MRARSLALLGALAGVALLELNVAAGAAQSAPTSGASIRVVTIPAVAKLRFTLGRAVYTTDRRGSVTIPTQRITPQLLSDRVLLASRLRLLPDRRADGSLYRLERWYGLGCHETATAPYQQPRAASSDCSRPG